MTTAPTFRDQAISDRLWGQLPILVFALAGFGACLWAWTHYRVNFGFENVIHNAALFVGWIVLFGGPLLFWRMVRDKPDSPVAWIKERLRDPGINAQFIVGLPLVALCIAIVPAFSSIKSMIPLFTDYTWDETFIAWDRAIFFGYDAWEVLQPVLGYPIVTSAIAAIYHMWAALLYLGPLYLAFSPRVSDDTRRAFFMTYAAAWVVIGGLMATWLASVGPVVAEPILGIDTFRAQTDYLAQADAQVPVLVVPVQELLVERYFTEARSLGSGITAMPSMHVAICVLYWLAMRRVSPAAGKFFFGFMVVIWIGSVHTGYHYAVDGMVSLVATVALWSASVAVFRWWDRRRSSYGADTFRTNTVPAE